MLLTADVHQWLQRLIFLLKSSLAQTGPLAHGIMRALINTNSINQSFVDNYTIGYEKYKTDSKRFHTSSGKIEFTSNYLKEMGYEELPEYKSPTYLKDQNKEYPYVLITGARKLMLVNSRYQNIKKALSKNSVPEMEIHVSDARQLRLKNGELVKVISKVGELKMPIKIMEENEILKGVIQITHGWKNVNVNLLTPDDINDPIDGFPLMKAVQVKIKKIEV